MTRSKSPLFLALCFGCAAHHRESVARERIPEHSVDSLTTSATGERFFALVGTVVDSASGRPLEAATVLLKSDHIDQPTHGRDGPWSDPDYWVPTDRHGGFLLGHVRPGRYHLLVRRVGYYAYKADTEARAGVVDTLRVRLQLYPYGLSFNGASPNSPSRVPATSELRSKARGARSP
jgi:hypothetical protein